jgi:YesN/AraC family two-component response regulator
VQQTLDCTLDMKHATLAPGQVMKRILIADDSAVVRRGLRELIEHTLDWDVCGEAVNGREAIQAVRELHPDILLLDLAMPGMSGFDTARELAKVEPKLPFCCARFNSPLTW